MAISAEQRLGVADFGDTTSPVGNFLTYPRRLVIATLKLLFAQEDFFTSTPSGEATFRNPFLYLEKASGAIDSKSRIIISDQANTRGENKESRPRIIVDRVSGAFQHGHFAQSNGWTQGTKSFQNMFESDLNIRCVGKHKLESEMLAVATTLGLTMFHSYILTNSKLHSLSIPTAGPTVPERSDAEVDQHVTTLTMRSAQPLGWTLSNIESKVVNQLCLSLKEV